MDDRNRKQNGPDMIRPRISIAEMYLLCLLFLVAAILLRTGRETGDCERQAGVAAETAASPNDSTSLHYPDPFKCRPPIQTIPFKSGILRPESSQSASNSVPNEWIVKLKPGATNIEELAFSLRAQVAGRIDTLHAYRLQFADAADASAAHEQLAAHSDVDYVDSNYAISLPPGGEMVGSSSESSARLPIRPGDAGGKLVVGLIDTAVQVQGSGLDESFFLQSIAVAGESSDNPGSLRHGTSMAETILQGLSAVEAGKSDTSVRILSVDVYGDSDATTSYQVAEGIVKAIEKGATMINLSLGTDGDSSLLLQVIEDAHAQGITFVGAAGNEPVTTPTYPAAYSGVVAVTAIDDQGHIAPYANYGDFVDIGAPGTVLVSYDGNSYLVTGTSASTAMV